MKKALLGLISMILVISLSSCEEGKNVNTVDNNINNSEQTVQNKISEEIKPEIKDISKQVQNWEISSEEAEKAMKDSINSSDTMQSQLEKSKDQMPKILQILKANRKCIVDSDNKSDAKDCETKAIELAKKLWISDMFDNNEKTWDFEWNEQIKKETLTDIDSWIKEFEAMLPCIEKAENMTDMMQCGNE